MKFFPIVSALFAAQVLAKDGCGFPDGPECKSLGKSDGVENFADDGCCLLPARCITFGTSNCARVSAAKAPGAKANKTKTGKRRIEADN